MKPAFRRQMGKLLEEEGYSSRSHDAHAEVLFPALEAIGGERAQPRVAGRWVRRHAPLDSIAAWQGKEGLAGYNIPEEVKERVVAQLLAWAKARYGNLESPLEQEEYFQLEAIYVQAA